MVGTIPNFFFEPFPKVNITFKRRKAHIVGPDSPNPN